MPSILAALRLTKVKPVDGSAPHKKEKKSSYMTQDELEIRNHMECQIDSFFGGAPVVKSRPAPVAKPPAVDRPKRYKLDVLPPAYVAPGFNEPLPEYKEPNTLPPNLMPANRRVGC